MSLPRLQNVMLKHNCPDCGHGRVKPGSWFRAIRQYKCEGCGSTVVVTYDMKLRLHARYASQNVIGF